MLTSVRNPKVAAALRLSKRAFRERDRAFLVEGAQAVREALARPGTLRSLFVTDPGHPLARLAAEQGVEVHHVSEDLMRRLSATVTPQGLVGVATFLDVDLGSLDRPTCVAMLHAVRDPGNAGTIVRSADGAGADAVVFSSASVDPYNPKTVRASAGSLFHLPIVREADTAEAVASLRRAGLRVVAMAADGEEDLYQQDLTRPTAFLFGNEAWGLPEEVARLADVTARIPLAGRAESLNLAAAASVTLFERARQRRQGRRVALETLIAAAAHDIRSPLTAMKGFGYALATRWDQMTPDQRELMLRGIMYDTDRLNGILRQLVDAARLVSGTLDLLPERVRVGAVVEQIAASVSRDPEHPPVELEGSDLEVFCDPERLRLVLEAFVEALVWWGRRGPIRVAASRRDGRLVVRAARAGGDLAPEAAASLFEPRAPGTGGGSKIGLWVARGVAEAMGGSVSARTGEELVFVLEVPEPSELAAGGGGGGAC